MSSRNPEDYDSRQDVRSTSSSLREPRHTKKCPQCNELHQNRHSQYCSVLCEEGKRAPPISDPRSEGYHLHLQGEPEHLVGKTLVAKGLKYTDDVTEDWHKSPSDLPTVWQSNDGEELVYETTTVIGTVAGFDEDGYYIIEKEYLETGELTVKRVLPSDVVAKVRRDEWWVEG